MRSSYSAPLSPLLLSSPLPPPLPPRAPPPLPEALLQLELLLLLGGGGARGGGLLRLLQPLQAPPRGAREALLELLQQRLLPQALLPQRA